METSNEEVKPVEVETASVESPETVEEKVETDAEIGARLKEMAERYEIPDSFEGHGINSITGFKTVGNVTYAIANCDDRCTYDVPLTLKSE